MGSGSSHGSDSGVFAIQAGMTPENLRDVITVACAAAKSCGEAIEGRDFMRARNTMLAELASVKERPFQLGMYLAGQFFRHGTARGPAEDMVAVRKVEIADLVATARRIFAAPPTLSLVGPIEADDYLGLASAALA